MGQKNTHKLPLPHPRRPPPQCHVCRGTIRSVDKFTFCRGGCAQIAALQKCNITYDESESAWVIRDPRACLVSYRFPDVHAAVEFASKRSLGGCPSNIVHNDCLASKPIRLSVSGDKHRSQKARVCRFCTAYHNYRGGRNISDRRERKFVRLRSALEMSIGRHNGRLHERNTSPEGTARARRTGAIHQHSVPKLMAQAIEMDQKLELKGHLAERSDAQSVGIASVAVAQLSHRRSLHWRQMATAPMVLDTKRHC